MVIVLCTLFSSGQLALLSENGVAAEQYLGCAERFLLPE